MRVSLPAYHHVRELRTYIADEVDRLIDGDADLEPDDEDFEHDGAEPPHASPFLSDT